MPHTRQTVSFDVALVLEEDFFTGAFGELEILDKFLIEFAGVERIFKIFKLLACKCNQHMAVISKVLDDQHILTTIELFEVQSPFRCSTLDRKSRSRAQSLLPLPD